MIRRSSLRYLVLAFVLLFSLLNQWSRWLPVYLSTVRLDECVASCSGVSFEPLCKGCAASDTQCIACNACRTTYDSARYNLQDGVCMTSAQYGVLTGVGFSLTFSVFGLVAGFFVDVTAERGATVLGLSAFFAGVVSWLCAYCRNFGELVALRAVLGGLQAFGAPASVQMITSHFKRASERPMANAAYTVGLYLGAGLSSLSTLVAERYGWRSLFWLVGGVGIGVAGLYELTVDLRCAFCVVLAPLWAPSGNDATSRGGNGVGGAGDNSAHASAAGYSQLGRKTEGTALLSDGASGWPRNYSTGAGAHAGDGPPAAGTHTNTAAGAGAGAGSNGSGGGTILVGTPAGDEERLRESGMALVPGEYLLEDAHIDFAPSGDSYRDESVVVTPQRAPQVEYTYFSAHAARESDDDDDDVDVGDEDEAISPRHRRRREIDRRVLGSANRPVLVVLYTLFMGDKVTGAMPLLLLASSIRFVAGIATFVFYPILVSRRFPGYDQYFSIFNAVVVLSCGSFSSFVGGKVGQWVVHHEGLHGLAKLVAATCLLCAVPFGMAFHEARFWPSVLLLALGYLIGEAWMGASMALLQGLAPSRGQGLSMSLFLFLNWNSSALATDVIGYLDPGTDAIAEYLVIFTAVPLVLSCCCFLALSAVLGRAAAQKRLDDEVVAPAWAPGWASGRASGSAPSRHAGKTHRTDREESKLPELLLVEPEAGSDPPPDYRTPQKKSRGEAKLTFAAR